MPLTFPAHAAAILPFQTRVGKVLPPVALVVGTCAPDLAYVLGMYGEFSHTFHGLLLFSVPAGFMAYLWAELLLLPTLIRTLPTTGRIQWARFAVSRGLPSTARGWCATVVAILVGAVTHLLWDGFTHRTLWPAKVLYPRVAVELLGQRIPLTHLLQHGSSIVGSAVVILFMARQYKTLPAVEQGTSRGFAALSMAVLLGMWCGLIVRSRHVVASPHDERIWSLFWTAIAGGLVALTMACAVFAVLGGSPEETPARRSGQSEWE